MRRLASRAALQLAGRPPNLGRRLRTQALAAAPHAATASSSSSAGCSPGGCAACPSDGLGDAGCSRGAASASAAAGSDAVPPKVAAVFAGLSKTIHRGFKFDRMFQSDDVDPETLVMLDQVAMMSMKTQEVPAPIMDKIVTLLHEFAKKKDLERYGRYLLKKTRSRTSAETPSVLSSWFLPEQHGNDSGPLAKLKKNPAFKDLFDHAGVGQMDDSALRRLAAANKEERRHVLYQVFWSPEASLAYLAHRFPASWAANLRVLYEIARRAPNFRQGACARRGGVRGQRPPKRPLGFFRPRASGPRGTSESNLGSLARLAPCFVTPRPSEQRGVRGPTPCVELILLLVVGSTSRFVARTCTWMRCITFSAAPLACGCPNVEV